MTRSEEIRELWLLAETVHSIVYFAPEKVDAYKHAGLRGGWMGYFASRSAAMGTVGPEVVSATFYNFHPSMVRKSIPDAWTFSTPQRVLDARYSAVSVALGRLLPDAESTVCAIRAAAIVKEAMQSASCAGRSLFAAHAALPWPEDPLLAVWHGCTLWREYRGDGHVAALVTENIDGCEAHLLAAAAGSSSEEMLRGNRGWSEDEWADARKRLRSRGLLDTNGGLTPRGSQLKRRLEERTDELSAAPWSSIGPDALPDFKRSIRPLAAGVISGGDLPFPNPMGIAEAELEPVLRAAGS